MECTDAEILRALLAPLFAPEAPVRLPTGTPDQQILAVARHHKLSPALAALPETAFSPALLRSFQQDRLNTLGRGTLLRHTLREVLEHLEEEGVTSVLLKGMAYEELLYPFRGTRPATDVDLLIRQSARPRAFKVFRTLGFQPSAGGPGFDEPDYHEVTLRRGDVYVDLHVGLAPFVRCPIDYVSLWQDITSFSIDGVGAHALSRSDAAVNHALHMAIHHFDVPGLYLLDLARLLADPAVKSQAPRTAARWRCLRAWQTSTALMTAFIPAAIGGPNREALAGPQRRVIDSFGGLREVSRSEQLRRKIEHFDSLVDAARYMAVQGRRVLRERWISRHGAPSATERLGWPPGSPP